MVSAYYAGMLACALPAGWLVDRFGLRTMLFVAHGLLAVGGLSLSVAGGAVAGSLALVLCGVGYAFINPSTARAVLIWFPRTSRGTVMSLKQTGVPAGGVVAAAIAATGQSDWRALMLAMSVVTVVAAASYAFLPVARQLESHAVRFVEILALMKLPRLAWFNLASAVYAFGQAAFFAYLVLYARDAVAASLAVASFCLAIAHISSAMGRVTWGVVSDRNLSRGRLWCIVAIGIFGALGVILLAAVPILGSFALIGASALVGFTLGGYAGLIQAATVELVDVPQVGAAIGYNMLLLCLGTMAGPALFGFSVEAVGYGPTWYMLALIVASGALFYRRSARCRP